MSATTVVSDSIAVPLDFTPGAPLVLKYESSWSYVHKNTSIIVSKAAGADKVIQHVQNATTDVHQQFNKLQKELDHLGLIRQTTQKMNTQLDQVTEIIADLEELLMTLRQRKLGQELLRFQNQERQQLDAYAKKKSEELQHMDRVMRVEFETKLEEDRRRKHALEEQERKRLLEEQRKQQEEAKRLHIQQQEEMKRQQQIQHEEYKKQKQAQEELRKKQEEERRQQFAQEQLKRKQEEEARKKQEEEEARKKQEEEEAKKKEQEEQERLAMEKLKQENEALKEQLKQLMEAQKLKE